MVNKEHITLSQGYTRNICKKKKKHLEINDTSIIHPYIKIIL